MSSIQDIVRSAKFQSRREAIERSRIPAIIGDPKIISILYSNDARAAAEAVNIAQAQAQAAENSAAAENVPAPGAEAEQAQAQPVYFYPQTTVKPRFGLVHVFLLVGSVYLLKKIFRG